MADAMDAVQQQALDAAEDALLRHQARPAPAGRTSCANLDCGESIHPARTALGAQLCLECQHEQDARDAHFNTWRRR